MHYAIKTPTTTHRKVCDIRASHNLISFGLLYLHYDNEWRNNFSLIF